MMKTIIIDVGAKFTKISRVLEQRCSYKVSDFITSVKAKDPVILKAALQYLKDF